MRCLNIVYSAIQPPLITAREILFLQQPYEGPKLITLYSYKPNDVRHAEICFPHFAAQNLLITISVTIIKYDFQWIFLLWPILYISLIVLGCYFVIDQILIFFSFKLSFFIALNIYHKVNWVCLYYSWGYFPISRSLYFRNSLSLYIYHSCLRSSAFQYFLELLIF